MKISIVFYSETGNTAAVAGFVAKGAETVEDTEVRLFNLREPDAPDKAYLADSAAVIFGTPTYCGNMCWQMKKWFDTAWDVNLGGKLGSVFATENSPNGGGAELAIMAVVNHLLVKGMLVYSSGAERGRPFIHIGPTVVRDQISEKEEICGIFGRRIAQKAHELFADAGCPG